MTTGPGESSVNSIRIGLVYNLVVRIRRERLSIADLLLYVRITREAHSNPLSRHRVIGLPGVDGSLRSSRFKPSTTVFAFPPRGLMSFVFRGSDGIKRIASRLLNVIFECFASVL